MKKAIRTRLSLHVSRHAQAYDPDWDCKRFEFSFGVYRADRDLEWGEVRTTKAGRVHVRDLGGVVFAGPRHADYAICGFDLEYRDVYSVRLRDAESMVGSLRLVDRKMRAIAKKYGPAESLGAFVRRLCAVLGVEEIEFAAGMLKDGKGPTIDVEVGAVWIERLVREACAKQDVAAT